MKKEERKLKHTWSKLVEQAKKNDQDAFYDLYQNSYDAVYRTVRSMVRDEDAALDIVQDAFVKGFASMSSLEDPEQFLPWMKRIATNKAKDWFKKKQEMTFSQLSDEDGNEPDFEDERTENLPEEVLDRNETARLINEILNSLPDEQRMAIGMFYYQNMTISEIAEELEISENTVKSRLNYGKKKIKASVEDLEKRGTKLYSLAPIPFLMLLFRNQILQATAGNAPAAAFGSIMAASSTAATGTAAAASAGTATVTAAAGQAGGGLLATLGAKIIAGVLAVTLVGSIGTGVYLANRDRRIKPPVVSEEVSVVIDVSEEWPEPSEPVVSEESVAEVPTVSAEELLTQYLEEELIPEKGIYNFAQTVFYIEGRGTDKEMLTRSEYRYDSDMDIILGESFLIRYDPDPRPWDEDNLKYQAALQNLESRDTSGLYCGDLSDYDGDGDMELLTVYGENGDLYLEMFDTNIDAVISTGKMKLFEGVDPLYSQKNIYRRPAEDGKGCRIIIRNMIPINGTSTNFNYFLYTSDLKLLSLMSTDRSSAVETFYDGRDEIRIALERNEDDYLLSVPKMFETYGLDASLNGHDDYSRDGAYYDSEWKTLCTFFEIGAGVNDFAQKYYKVPPVIDPEPVEDPAPVLSAEEILTKYFEEVLLPEKGIYNIEQPTFIMGQQNYIDLYTCKYDPDMGQFNADFADGQLPWSKGYEEMYAAYEAAKANADISGLYFGKYFDWDSDGESELLVIYGENDILYVELFDISGGEVISVAKLSLAAFGSDYTTRLFSYRVTAQGINYIIEDSIWHPEDESEKKVGCSILYRLSGDLKPISAILLDPYWTEGTFATELFYDGREERTIYIDLENYESVLAEYGGYSIGSDSTDRQSLYYFWETGGFQCSDAKPDIPMTDYFIKYYYGANGE